MDMLPSQRPRKKRPEEFIDTKTLDNHIIYTRVEFSNSEYYKSVLFFLQKVKITSMLDLGGCTGETSLIFLDYIPECTKFLIVEPIEENYNFTRKQIQNEDKIDILNKAIFYGSDKVKIDNSGAGVGSWSITLAKQDSKEYETITLEKIYEEFGEFDFIKIDIEGAERNLIENSIKLQEVKYLEIEFHRELIESKNWKKYTEKWLPNHKLIYGGDDGRKQDGSGFFVRKDLL